MGSEPEQDGWRVFRVWRLVTLQVESRSVPSTDWHGSELVPRVYLRSPVLSDLWRWLFWRCDGCGGRFGWREGHRDLGWVRGRWHMGECAVLAEAAMRLGDTTVPKSMRLGAISKWWLVAWWGLVPPVSGPHAQPYSAEEEHFYSAGGGPGKLSP